jgi:enoyl-CoA hydratase/carnithine racemase
VAECEVLREGAVAWIRLAAPALTATMAGELADACRDADADGGVRVLVVTGARAGEFLVGAHLADEAEHAAAVAAVETLAAVRTATLAAIDGAAHGAGLELALACDLRVASERATFALPQLHEGTMPFLGGTQRLPRVIGRARALDLLLTGRTLTASEALAWGLSVRTAATARFLADVAQVVDGLVAAGPLALALAKEAVLAAFDLPLAEGLRLEEDLYVLLQTTDDRAEGVRAFLERRVPRFGGR